MGARLGAGFEIDADCFPSVGEIDRQKMRPGFLGVVEHGIGEDAEVWTNTRRQRADGQPVDHPERMVADDHQRAGTRPCLKCALVECQLETQARDGLFPEIAGPAFGAILVIDSLQPGLARHPFDQADDETLQRRIAGRGIGEGLKRIAAHWASWKMIPSSIAFACDKRAHAMPVIDRIGPALARGRPMVDRENHAVARRSAAPRWRGIGRGAAVRSSRIRRP